MTARRGRVAVIGAGPAGMATALSVCQASHEVLLLERYPEARPAGNILNLWPPPVKALGLLGVDITDLGAPCYTEFRSVAGHTRVRVELPDEVIQRYAGGFIGLLRPDLYERLLSALPPGVLQVNRLVDRFEQDEAGVRLYLADGKVIEADLVVGADGIDSLVRRTLWGDIPKREHNLHIFGGFTFDDTVPAERGQCLLHHSRTVQGSWSAIRSKGRDGYQWWVLGAHDARQAFDGDRHATAAALASGFPAPLPELVAATDPAHVQRWVLRDRKPVKQWSKGRATIVGDAAHPTSPYAAYGAGMATEDGYFLGRRLAGVDLSDLPPCGGRCRTSRPRASRTPPGRCSRRSSWASSSTTPRRRCRPSGTRSWITRRSCRRSWASPRPVRSSSSSRRSTQPSSTSPPSGEGVGDDRRLSVHRPAETVPGPGRDPRRGRAAVCGGFRGPGGEPLRRHRAGAARPADLLLGTRRTRHALAVAGAVRRAGTVPGNAASAWTTRITTGSGPASTPFSCRGGWPVTSRGSANRRTD